jgi:hypothetical protein
LACPGIWPSSRYHRPTCHSTMGRVVIHLLSPQQPDHSIDDERAEASCSPASAVEVQVRAPRQGIPAMHGTMLVTLHGPACRLGPCLGLPPKPVRRHWPSSNVGVCGLMAACQHVPIQTFGKHPDSDNRSAGHTSFGECDRGTGSSPTMTTNATAPCLLQGGKSINAGSPQVVSSVAVSRGWLEILI